jgi:hypothetical protein
VVWSITGGKSYVGEKAKSMKGVELGARALTEDELTALALDGANSSDPLKLALDIGKPSIQS